MLIFPWKFEEALELTARSWCFYSLNYLAALSLCLVLGRASTLLTLRSWFLLEHGTLFLLRFVTH